MTKRDPMRIKSYFAKSVDQALAEARAELGAEAMLLNTRRVPATQAGGGGYEVILGVRGEAAVESAGPVSAPAAMPAANRVVAPVTSPMPNALANTSPKSVAGALANTLPKPAAKVAARSTAKITENEEGRTPEQLASELRHLHSQMDEIRGLIVRSSRAHAAASRNAPELTDVYSRLLAADVEPALAKEIVDRVEASLSVDPNFEQAVAGADAEAHRWKVLRSDPARLEAFLRVELESRVALAPRLGPETGMETETDEDYGPVVVLVGPRGAGKTTSLAKLAVSAARFSDAGPARLVSLDTSRATAHLQLQSVASTYHIAFQEVAADYLLPKVITEARRSNTLFVDTPGYTGADGKAAEALASAFEGCPELDVHLVVPGYMKARDLRDCIERYAPFRPSKLLVTKVDETQTLGSAFSEAARAGMKLSFLAFGPGIPHDIRPASSEDLLGMAIERRKARAQQVA